MEVHFACSSSLCYRRDHLRSTRSFTIDNPASCKQTDFRPHSFLRTCLSRSHFTSIPSWHGPKLAPSCWQRAGASHLQRNTAVFCGDIRGVSFFLPYWSLRCLRQSRVVLSLRRVLLGSIKQHWEGASFLNQDESTDQKDRENGTLLSSSTPTPSALLADSFSAISEESFNETRRLVETAMLAAAAGLAYFLSNTFRIENYFGCFFPLPLVISSLRWGISAGRKTMVATGMLLLVLSGPLKAATYLLMHGFLGLTMGALWRLKISWGTSLLICTLVRSIGAMGFVFLTSWLIRENLLALITINAHASISLLLAAMGVNFVPSMGLIYVIFGTLVLFNCGTFVLILHLLYAIFMKRMGLKSSVVYPAWLKAL